MMNLREFGDYYNDFVAAGFGGVKEDPYYSDVSLLGKGTNWQDAISRLHFNSNIRLQLRAVQTKFNIMYLPVI